MAVGAVVHMNQLAPTANVLMHQKSVKGSAFERAIVMGIHSFDLWTHFPDVAPTVRRKLLFAN